MKRILSIGLVLCMLLSGAVLFTGCSKEESNNWPVTYGDVTIDKEPENIVVLNDVCADVISYIGYDIKMAGRSVECDQEFLQIVPTVGSAANPDVDAIAAAQTDLVIADSTLGADAKSRIEENGAKVLIMPTPSNDEELRQLYIDLGTVLGGKTTGSEKGESGYNELLEMLGTLNNATSNVVQTVAYLYINESGELCTFVKGTLEYKFFNYNGNTNVFSNQQDPGVNTMELRLGSPNYIFYDSDEVLTYLANDQNLTALNAVLNDHLYQLPMKAFRRYGTSAEEAVFEMLNFIEKSNAATADEATVAETTAVITEATDTTDAAAEAETVEETVADADTTQDDNVIEFRLDTDE